MSNATMGGGFSQFASNKIATAIQQETNKIRGTATDLTRGLIATSADANKEHNAAYVALTKALCKEFETNGNVQQALMCMFASFTEEQIYAKCFGDYKLSPADVYNVYDSKVHTNYIQIRKLIADHKAVLSSTKPMQISGLIAAEQAELERN